MKNLENIENTMLLRNPAYHETKRHSDTMFAYNIYPCTIPSDFTFVPLHWQDSMEIIYIKKGTGTVQVGFTSYTAHEGDIYLVLPGHLHGLRGIFQNRMEYENIIFDMSFLGSGSVDLCSQKYLQPVISEKIHLPAYIGKNHPLYTAIASCLDASDRLCASRPAGYELGVKGHMLLLFSFLMQLSDSDGKNDENKFNQKDVEKLKTVLARIEAGYSKKLTVASMAGECGYSASHFMRWFKEVTGTGFTAYLIEYRLGRAAHALRSSHDTVLEIAGQTGFDNLSNFNRLFRKRFGMTPGQFRRQTFSFK